MDTASTSTVAQGEIRARVESWIEAVKGGDVKAIMSHYASDVVAFDAVSQLQFKGVQDYGKHWEACMAMCPGPMIFEPRELDIAAQGDLAFGHCLLRCGMKDDKGQEKASWMRMSSCYRQIDGKWTIVHEHFSAPFDMQSGKALFDLTPDGAPAVSRIPRGMNSITPHLICAGAADAVEFYKKAFNATEIRRLAGPEGKLVHASVRIGDSVVMLMDEFPQWGSLGPKSLKGSPVTVHLYVDDVDASMERAAAAGAKVVMPAEDMFWGDRYGVVEDPFGHRWSIATHIRDVSPEEMQKGAQNACTQGAADQA
ncbi:Uncharacterized conserved protein PhnB, glyoxalase superfamily [Pollutimonas bauzanensis]|uniref:Uncharacterized conserved protein PhnB, glyoxalase superfamily n=2 Tax=Pollutimonas bauzanensis TaxID=658167 RepID=A0A1M5YFG2_9BURK|nr:Uncharacterized conserved protein PhnB, glyoxalase superfamily [Pollutimonas bauzanensis]